MIRVLHVDDEPDFAAMAGTFLERADDRITVRPATSATEALALLEEHEFDCLVSDYEMPRLNGIELLETVREQHPELPFILFTGKGSEAVASDAISAGVTDYLQKDSGSGQYPVLANRIVNAVERVRSDRDAAKYQRINDVVRRTNEALAGASTQREIDDAVCSIISAAEPYRFAWIGERDPDSATVVPRAAAGSGDEYLDTIEVTIDQAHTGQGPTGRAVRTGELAVMQDIPGEPDYEPWRADALERGYRSSAAIPLVHDDTSYGVLNVYADRTHAFDAHERQLLSNLGETIAHASHRVALQRQYTDQYRTLFEDAPVMIVLTRAVDGQPRIEHCNPAFADRLGYSADALRGTFLADHYSDESSERLAEDGYRRALTGEFTREQRTLQTRDGDEVLTILRAAPRRNADGEIVGTHALFLDITDEQQVAALERTNAVLSTLFDALPHGVLVEDESRQVLSVNRRVFDLFDLPGAASEVRGADCARLAGRVADQFGDPEAFADRIEALVADRRPVDGERLELTDGRTFERSYRPIELPDGEGHLWTYLDVTDRIEYHRTVHDLQVQTRTLIDARTTDEIATAAVDIAQQTLGFSLSGIHLVDAEGDTLEPVAVTDAVTDHLDGELSYARTAPTREVDRINWAVFMAGDSVVTDDIHDYADLTDADTPFRSGIVYPLGDHGVFVVSAPEPAAFDDHDVHLVEILGTIVTALLDRADREAELRTQRELAVEKSTRLEEFTKVLSHDLRNPLNVAQGRLELAREDSDSPDLETVDRALERMRTLLEELLVLARDADATLAPRPVDLGEIAARAWETVETGAATLDVAVDDRILADANSLTQLFENLFRNSVEHGSTDDAVEHGGDEVAVTVGALDSGFFVADDGPGIPADARDEVFEVGYSGTDGGSGFGLRIVEQIVDGHGWQIQIRDSDDGGARFEILDVEPAPE